MDGATNELRLVLSTPPPNWQPPLGTAPNNPIAILHASLEHVRDNGDERYLFLRTILEVLHSRGFLNDSASSAAPLSGEEEQLLFHCVTGLRHVILFRWDSFHSSLRTCVRDFLLNVGLGLSFIDSGVGPSGVVCLPRTVAMACLSGAASLWKRGWVAGNDSDGVQESEEQSYVEKMTRNAIPHMQRIGKGEDLFVYLNSLLLAPFEEAMQQHQQQQLIYQKRYIGTMSASFLSLLVGEFTGGNSSARYNLPVEFHRSCHRVFENGNHGDQSGLDATLHLSMTALSSLVGYVLNNTSSNTLQDQSLMEFGTCIINVTFDVLSWEFGAGSNKWDFSSGANVSAKDSGRGGVLLRPPQKWREVLIRPDFLGAVFHVYTAVRIGVAGSNSLDSTVMQKRGRMSHQLRQLLLQLASIAQGPIFTDQNERGAYAGFLLDGCLNVLETVLTEQQQHQDQLTADSMIWECRSTEIVDLVTMLSRITSNFRTKLLSQLATFQRFLSALCAIGKWLLESSVTECHQAGGDFGSMEGADWKNDAIAQILQCSEAMAGDYWLAGGSDSQEAKAACESLAVSLAPLYGVHCACRVRMASLEEHYLVREHAELDEAREEISATALEEEMAAAASLGRFNILASMKALSEMFHECMPRLKTLFGSAGVGGELNAEMAALLEEARMLIVCACHLLTDECEGETPAIPESVIHACQAGGSPHHEACTASIFGFINVLKSIAEDQALKATVHPEDPRLSPLLAKTLLWFFNRWGAAYVFPSFEEYRDDFGGILATWSKPESSQPMISFFTTLCLIYFCHWPQEKEVVLESTSLLLALGKKGPSVRDLLVADASFEKIVALHSVCAYLRHNVCQSEISAAMARIGGGLSMDMVKGYQRLPYNDRAKVLTGLIVCCSDMTNEKGTTMLNSCLQSIETPFFTVMQALVKKEARSQNIDVQESACLSILLYSGVVLASEMSDPERIPYFLSPSMPHLSGLMIYYAEDLTICESLLKLFRDYAERYLPMLTRDQCIILFSASTSLLKSYSEHHCKSRAIVKTSNSVEDFEEEQSYNDVLCAIQLLIQLGTKDFIDLCNTSKGVDSNQITDVIFFGLQQILPLMTQGLLRFPKLCTHYFTLVGFMVETYPKNLCSLPLELFDSLLDSLLFGMSHSDSLVSKSSLHGLAGLAQEHLKTHSLSNHLSAKPNIIENCTRRLLLEVIFQPIIWDRVEPAGMALLPLAAIDVHKFVEVINAVSQQYGQKQKRLHCAFEELIKPDILANVSKEGREGRVVRVQFKNDFDAFVRNVQAFLVMR